MTGRNTKAAVDSLYDGLFAGAPGRIRPATFGFEVRYSIQLSYGRIPH